MSNHLMSKSWYTRSMQVPNPPFASPIGLHLTRSARAVGRAFDEALASSGGSLSTWLILLQVVISPTSNQRELADAVGLGQATLTHHLNGMEKDGLLTRRRDPDNRRIHIVELTPDGDALFHQLRSTAMAFDAALRTGLADSELDAVRAVLDVLVANAEAHVHPRDRTGDDPSER
ncbi:MAG: hypothetical protein JWR52_756 [Marmoricola sp.]|nr:hypothetical protein [Marmoricola sp.]